MAERTKAMSEIGPTTYSEGGVQYPTDARPATDERESAADANTDAAGPDDAGAEPAPTESAADATTTPKKRTSKKTAARTK